MSKQEFARRRTDAAVAEAMVRLMLTDSTKGRFSLEYYVKDDKQACAMALRRAMLVYQDTPARRVWTWSRCAR